MDDYEKEDKNSVSLNRKIISFTKKPAKHGDYYIFHIPNIYIKEGLIDPEKVYTVYLKEEGKG